MISYLYSFSLNICSILESAEEEEIEITVLTDVLRMLEIVDGINDNERSPFLRFKACDP